jgi:secreted Zn-dependent insulinase-like peptidase
MIVNVKSDNEMSSFYVVFDGSVMNEKPGWYGLSHLMEHLVCKGITHLENDFQRYGINWNAYTSNTNIVFYIEGLDEYVNKYKQEFLEGLLSYNVTEEELENEKRIVIEEYKDAFNEQLGNHFSNLYRKEYNFYSPIGLRSDIENFTIDDCRGYAYLYLKQPTKIINISKYNDYNENVRFREPSGDFQFSKNQNKFHYIRSDESLEVPKDTTPLEVFNEYKNKESVIIYSDMINQDHNKINFVCKMLGMGLISPLYQEVREKKGLAYYVGCLSNKFNNEKSNIVIYTETSSTKVNEVIDQIKMVLSKYKTYLTQERFDIIKDYLKVKIKKDSIFKHSKTEPFIEPKSFQINEIIDEITLDEVYEIMDKYFTWDNFKVSVYSEEFKEA